MKFRCEIMRLAATTMLDSSDKINCRVHIAHWRVRVCCFHSIILLSHREISHYLLYSFGCSVLFCSHTFRRSLEFNVIVVKIANSTTTKKETPMKVLLCRQQQITCIVYIYDYQVFFVYNLLFCYRANRHDCVACMLFFSIMLSRPLFAFEHIFI